MAEIADMVRESEIALFERFKDYIAAASHSEAGILIWFS